MVHHVKVMSSGHVVHDIFDELDIYLVYEISVLVNLRDLDRAGKRVTWPDDTSLNICHSHRWD